MASLVRAACLTNYAEVAQASGLNGARMLLDAGLSPGVLDEPDLMIPVDKVGRLLQASATQSGNESFGLCMARSRLLSNMGPVGLLIRDQATLREAVVDLAGRRDEALEHQVRRAIESALATHPGDLLVFLPGQREIVKVEALLAHAGLPAEVLPLHGELPVDQQSRVLQPAPDGRRRVVLATNVAESSVTLPGVRVVIDSGLALTSAGVPWATMAPPCTPAPGPMSIT